MELLLYRFDIGKHQHFWQNLWHREDKSTEDWNLLETMLMLLHIKLNMYEILIVCDNGA